MMRRLHKGEEDLLRQAWQWDAGRPSWYSQMDRVFSTGAVEDFVAQLDDRRNAFMGVFDGELIGVILVVWCGDGRFTAHLMAKRGANIDVLTNAAEQVLYDSLNFGMEEASVWVAERNIGVRKLCESIGLLPDGVVMFKGSYRGRVIRWLRHSVRREQLLMDKAA